MTARKKRDLRQEAASPDVTQCECLDNPGNAGGALAAALHFDGLRVLTDAKLSDNLLRDGHGARSHDAPGRPEKGRRMEKAMIRTLILLVAVLVPLSASAQIGVNVNINVPLPPPIVFAAPPQVVVLPETDVYVVPDVEAEIFFSRGWWWRPWEGRWYRSRYYDRGWVFYRAAPPPFYRRVPPGWRHDFHEHRWKGREWKHERIPHEHVQHNGRGGDRRWQPPPPRGPQGMGPRPAPPPPRGPQGMGPRPAPPPPRGGDRGFQPGQPGHRPGGPPHGPDRGPGPGRGPEHRGGHGHR